MTIQSNDLGGYWIAQRLLRPVVYLDHWAVRLFSEHVALQDRFVEGLHDSGGTWLFSAVNLCEFTTMTDVTQAEAAERLLLRTMPALHVADTAADKGYLFAAGAPPHQDAPDQHWLLRDLAERARIAGGRWNTHRFIQDAIIHASELAPLFESMKKEISDAVMALTQNAEKNVNAKKFAPAAGMSLRDALFQELVREPHVNPAYSFEKNDAVDLIHAIPAAVVCDLVLLDARWCHKVESAAKRLRKGGVTGRIARCFSSKTVPNFLSALEMLKSRKS